MENQVPDMASHQQDGMKKASSQCTGKVGHWEQNGTSSVIWCGIRHTDTSPPPVMLSGVSLSCVHKQKHLSVTFDTKLNWSFYMVTV